MASPPFPRIAIIGTGIAGLGCAHFLQRRFDLTLFEQNDYAGGHTNTVTVREESQEVPIDTGFMVFNHVTYPLLTRLFQELGVATKRTDMSFSITHEPARVQYNGHSLNTIFGDRANVFRPRFWRFILQIDRFNKETVSALEDSRFASMSLQEYVRVRGYGEDFLNWYVVPMGGAVWSTPPDKMLQFPAMTLLRFWYNHGFLGMKTRHPWWTVVNGAKSYVTKLTQPFRDRIRLNCPVAKVERLPGGGVRVTPKQGEAEVFEKVILAAHADQTLTMLADPTDLERRLLSCFRYQTNSAILHTDNRFMPWNRRCWASWNYRVRATLDGQPRSNTHYWMNKLQGVSERVNYFVSIDAEDEVPAEKILKRLVYEHPLFDVPAIAAQEELPKLNALAREQSTYFCGSYFRYGFHEDAFGSAVALCRELLGEEPW